MDIKKIPKKDIIAMFQDDVNSSIEYNDCAKNRILDFRREFYSDNSNKVRISKGSWFTYNVFSERDMDTESIRDSMSPDAVNVKSNKSTLGNYSNIEWKLTRKLGEPLIANVTKPLIESTNNILIDKETDRNVIKSQVTEKLLNHFNDGGANRNAFFKRFSRNAVVDGTAFGRVGYSIENDEFKVEIKKELFDKLSTKYKDSKKVNVKKIEKKYYFIDKTNTHSKLTRGVLDPLAIHFDPTTPNMEDKSFFIVMENISVAECVDRYGNSSLGKLKDIAKLSYDYDSKVTDINRMMITLYEYWTKLDISEDKNTVHNRMCRVMIAKPYYKDNTFIVPTEANTLDAEVVNIIESPHIFNRIPFFRAFGFDGSSEDWGDGVSEFTKDLQSVQKKLINGLIDNTSNGVLNKWFIKKGFLSNDSKKALENNEPVIEFNRAVGGLRENMHQMAFNQLPSSVFSLFQLFSEQSEELTGINKTMTGSSGANLSASTSNFSAGLSLAQTRVAMVISNIKDALIDQNNMWADISSVLFDEDEVMKITGISIETAMIKYATEKLESLLQGVDLDQEDKDDMITEIIREEYIQYRDISSKFDISIKVASEASQEIKSAKIITLIQQSRELGKTLPADTINEFVAELADAQGFGHIVNKIRNHRQQPNPIQQQLDELEVGLKGAEIENIQAQTEKDKALAKNALGRTNALETKDNKIISESPEDLRTKQLDNDNKLIGEQGEDNGITSLLDQV